MLARLQQSIVLGLAALATGAFCLLWRAAHPALAALVALLVVFGQALFLALEFALQRLWRGEDPAPLPSAKQTLGAWLGEVAAATRVFGWQQPFRSERWPDHLPPQAGGRQGVLLIHGFVCNRGVWNPWLERLRELGVPYVAVNLEPVFGSIDGTVGAVEAAVRRVEAATARAPVVVAHSMGGLVLRRWWVEPGNADRIHRAMTIATPHAGTWLARFAFSANGRQMRRGSAWLTELRAREPVGRARAFTCFYGNCDNIVFPPSTATLAGADNRLLQGVAHVAMLGRPEPWDALRRLVG